MKQHPNWYPAGTLQFPYLPQEISAAQRAFPADVGDLIPSADDIPDAFTQFHGTEWNEIVSQWFYRGLAEKTQMIPTVGIDPEKALVHLKTIMGSYGIKHEYKEAAIAYLMSVWFEKVKGWKIKTPKP